MQRLLAAVLVVAACGGCASGAGTDPGQHPDSGVRGVVLIGPQCPVVTADSPCPDRPWSGDVRATRGSDRVEQQTDDEGRFMIWLAPGRWALVPLVEGGAAPSAKPLVVDVRPHAVADVTLTVDSGIR